MRAFSFLALIAVLACPVSRGDASVSAKQPEALRSQWELDHYFYDASLHREWEVLVDRVHPDAPARVELVPFSKQSNHDESVRVAKAAVPKAAKPNNASRRSFIPVTIRAGELVSVSNSAQSSVSISMRGTAMQTASFGHKIRVLLNPSGRFLSGVVRGPHLVELAAPAKISWGKR